MKLSTLHRLLGDLVETGWGEHRVIDNNGNDIGEMLPPDETTPESDESAIMLGCFIDKDGRWS